MDFKLDPEKVEKGLYSEEDMLVLGKTKSTCCKKRVYEVRLGAPKIRKAKSNSEGLITVIFD
jgi:hypothetical protein